MIWKKRDDQYQGSFDRVESLSLLRSSSGCRGDGVVGGGGEGSGCRDFRGNVSKPAAGCYQTDELHAQQGVQATVQQHLRQHGGTQQGQDGSRININHKTFCYVRNELQHLSIPFLCVLLNLS